MMTQKLPLNKRLEIEIFRILSKKHGLKINREATSFLVSFFNAYQIDQENLQENLDFIAKEWIHEYSKSDKADYILGDSWECTWSWSFSVSFWQQT